MRRALNALYEGCAVLGGLFLIALCVFVIYSVGPGIGLWMKDSLGLPNPFTYIAGSADEFAGFCMAASAFLAMASTFGKGEHIRVSLILQRFEGTPRRAMEIWCLLLGVALTGYLAWYVTKMCVLSYRFNDVSTGLVPVKLWIPQLGLAAGAIVFVIAMLDKLIVVLGGGEIVQEIAPEDAHIER